MLEGLYRIIWSTPMLIALIGFGLYLLIRLDWLPLRRWKWVWQQTIGSIIRQKKDRQATLKAVSVAIGGTMGIGNIVGVGSAVLLFGPGTLFWMWVSALIGMIYKFAEIVLAFAYRKVKKEIIGGPMYVMEAIPSRMMAVAYALCCVVTSLGIGNVIPVAAMVETADMLKIPSWLILIGISIIMLAVFIKGGKMIETISAYLVPFMTVVFFIFSLYVLVCYGEWLPVVWKQIFADVGNIGAMASGYWLVQMRTGLSRGIYSNEAGLGSATIAHVQNRGKQGCEQGAWGIVEVWLDTVLSCTATALVVLIAKEVGLLSAGLEYIAVLQVFSYVYGPLGELLYAGSMMLFALSSMLAWCYYAFASIRYLSDQSGWYVLYEVVYLLLLWVGALMPADVLWLSSDILNGCMVIIHVSAMVAMRKEIVQLTKSYFLIRENHVKLNG